MEKNNIPKGIRLCNPCNIRYTPNVWVGEVRPSLDPQFKQFRSMAYGYRAALLLVRNYVRKYGCDTIKSIVTRWAPPSENSTSAYVKAVCKQMGGIYDEAYVIDPANEEVMCALVAAMSYVENGIKADMGQVKEGWRLLAEDYEKRKVKL